MMPGRLVANDKDHYRMKRLLNVVSAYLESYEQNFAQELVEFKNSSAQHLGYNMPNSFDRYIEFFTLQWLIILWGIKTNSNLLMIFIFSRYLEFYAMFHVLQTELLYIKTKEIYSKLI